ncbi:hypothetical protein [Actinoplanes solisilvae]|uniref:hypothetical protein n=1 Tax=Actinoplanes solisilvae TaxID=2486853 RepID=UPI000FD7D080|nr:hypothetical protein [Actinoplanes solisilvae]
MTAVLLLVAGGLLAYFGERIGGALINRVSQLRKQPPTFADHFRGLRSSGTDFLAYTLTARPHLSITDVLYFELVSHLLSENRVQATLITVWWPSTVAPKKSDTGERSLDEDSHYVQYIRHLEKRFGERIEFVHQFADGDALVPANSDFGRRIPGDAGLPDIFWSALKQLTSKDYYLWVRNLGVPARRLRHLNRARPGDQVLEGLVAHTIHNSRLAPDAVERLKRLGPRHGSELVLSVLFWELEVDRLAVYYELYNEQKNRPAAIQFMLNPVAGRTIRATARKASDNHTAGFALSLAKSPIQQVERLSRLTRRETAGYVRALTTVLTLNYGLQGDRRKWAREATYMINEWRAAERVARVPRLSRGQLELLYLMDEWRRRWHNR